MVPPPLPEIINLRLLVETAPAVPPQIIECVLHQGCKMILREHGADLGPLRPKLQEQLARHEFGLKCVWEILMLN